MSHARAKKVARAIVERFGNSLPVDVEGIVRAHNIAIRKQPLEDTVSGVLVIKDGQAIIGVNENHHPNRQRFSIAHEFGHYHLHRDSASFFIDASPVFFRDDLSASGTEKQEIEANSFAAELLMPEPLLRQKLKNERIDMLDEVGIQELASELAVSVQALTIRLTQLRLIRV